MKEEEKRWRDVRKDLKDEGNRAGGEKVREERIQNKNGQRRGKRGHMG